VLVASILAGTMSTALMQVSFEIHKDYISEVLCINKDKPAMNCHGQCYLTTEVKKDVEGEPDSQRQIQPEQSFHWYLSPAWSRPAEIPVSSIHFPDQVAWLSQGFRAIDLPPPIA